jgi:serine/threonine protein kinase
VKQIFTDALDAPRGKRASFLAAACAGDEQLRREVLELFLLHGEPTRCSTCRSTARAHSRGSRSRAAPRSAPYRLVRELGRGGMGVVHLAEKDGHAVAVKLLAAGAVSPELRERFRLEAEILGRLDHDGIARVVDVGEVIGAGGVPQPWIAMEHVEGVPLHEYVQRERLALEPRLELLALVCDAVQHAHAHGVIHRDLKPANILVRADGRPVVLDFGVARLAGGDERPTELATRTGQLLGTPQYMSPEQVQAESAGLTPASDVYSLGVIAYELCAGQLPYEASSVSLHRAIVIILSAEPRPLGKLDRRFRGALERVIAKALEKRPADRYRDAGEFADDVRRKLAGRPVRAPGPSVWRVVSRWSRARRRLVAALLTLLLAGLFVETWIMGTGRRPMPREAVLAAYREAETLTQQAVPLLYEGERTPSRLRQAIDLYSRARLQVEQVPPLRTHDRLLRFIEKDLGTAQFVLGELTWDLQPYRTSAVTLAHAVTLSPDTLAGWQWDIQLQPLGIPDVPQRDLYGLLAAAYLGQYRLWGESNAILNAQYWSAHVARRVPAQFWSTPTHRCDCGDTQERSLGVPLQLAHGRHERGGRFRADSALARDRRAVLRLGHRDGEPRSCRTGRHWARCCSSADARSAPTACSRGRARRSTRPRTTWRRAPITADPSGRGCSRRPGRSSRAWRSTGRGWAASARREAWLRQAAVATWTPPSRVLRPTELPLAASASLRSLDAELLAELALGARRPALLEQAEAQLARGIARVPLHGRCPREAGWVCIRQAVLARAAIRSTGERPRAGAGARRSTGRRCSWNRTRTRCCTSVSARASRAGARPAPAAEAPSGTPPAGPAGSSAGAP